MKNSKSNTLSYDVIVIGGGASGIMSAIEAGRRGRKVLLIEKNKNLGEKLKISGGGRCNITNATYDTREFLKNYGKSSEFLFSTFSSFGVKDTFSFFENLNLPLVVQARNRAFPHTEKASDVVRVMVKALKDNNVKVITGSVVKNIIHEGNKIQKILVDKNEYTAISYILATGGVSHPETGSTGDGFKWLEDLGHKVKAPTPTIVPIATSDKWIHALSGISLSFMKITFFVERSNSPIPKKAFSKTGKILFTHFGLSGPLILNSASQIWDLLQEGIVTAKIDAYPDTEINILDEQITKIFDKNKNKTFKNVLKEILPLGTMPGIVSLLKDIDEDTKVHSITKIQRRKIVDTLKALPVNVTHLMGYDRAVIADGGVLLSEIDTKTMRSKILNNLFITGDLLNINRPSGGYSLQLCWTTGYVAGNNA
ncbi:MAG: NAD(P)/FAD-dependent oxidoreductase [Candidatus Paceibacterota bacterium]